MRAVMLAFLYFQRSSIVQLFNYTVSRDGRVLKRYEPTDKMSDIEADIQMEVNPAMPRK